jgi:Plasmid pRiA4b ORF-3-like protein
MVIRILAVPDSLPLHQFDATFCAVRGWDHIGFLFRVPGQEFNSFRRAPRSRTLREFQLRPTETFVYTCGAIDLWEWEVRLLDEESGSVGDDAPLCLGGRGAAPPQFCGGPTGYCLMLKRQRLGEAMCTPVQMEAVLEMLAASDPEVPPGSGGPIARSSRKGSKASIAGCKSTARWSRSASTWKRPTSAWPGVRT